MTKVGIIGDVHLGASYSLGSKDPSTGINSRLIDYSTTLESTIAAIARQGAEYLVFTGDIFETRHPSVVQQKMFSQALSLAISLGFKHVYVVLGNHDQQRAAGAHTLSYLHELNLPNITVYDDLGGCTFMGNDGLPTMNLILMPYRDRKWFEIDDYDKAIEKYRNDLSFVHSGLDPRAPTIAVGHFAIEGTMFSEEDSDLYGDNNLFLPKNMFNSIDFTVMGHVHAPQIISEYPKIAYVGSMEKRSHTEVHKKTYCIIDTKVKSWAFYDEPARDIYEVKLELADQIYTEDLMGVITKKIDRFASNHSLGGNILKVGLSILAEDSRFLDIPKLESYIKTQHKVNHCVPIKPSLFSVRQVRDSNITEHSTDEDAFLRFVKNTMTGQDFYDDIVRTGLEIIRGGKQ